MTNLQVQAAYALPPLTLPAPAAGAAPAALAAAEALPFAELLARRAAGTLVPGQHYRVQQRPTTTLGSTGEVLVLATAPTALAPEAVLATRVPDYAGVPLWSAPPGPGPVADTTYTQETGPFVAEVPGLATAVDRHVSGDDVFYKLPLPFAFTFGGITYTEVGVDTNGRLVFGDANYQTVNGQQRLGSSAVPLIAFAWCDLVVSPATFCSFVVGEAPRRRLVFDYQHSYLFKREFWGGLHYDTADIVSGQLVLEEGTNRITVGMARNLNPDTNVVQGIQYAGHGYNLYEGQALPSGVMTTFTPQPAYQATDGALALAEGPVVWRGATWVAAAGPTAAEPGPGSPDWVPAPGAGHDAFGNAVPAYDAITYDAALDAVLERRDAAGNCVAAAAGGDVLAAFPWGHPGVRANTLRDTLLDESLLTTPSLQFEANTLVGSSLARVQLAGVACRANCFYGVHLADYAPTELAEVTAFYDFDQRLPGASQRVFGPGGPLPTAADGAAALEAGLAAFKAKFVAPGFVTYRAGQAPDFTPLDLLTPFNSDFTPHDLIALHGYFAPDRLCLRNQDYRVRGDATFQTFFLGAATKGLNLSVTGLTFLQNGSLSPATTTPEGHRIRLLRCTLASLDYYGQGGSTMNVYHLTQCTIGRLGNMNSQGNQRTTFDGCTLGLGTLSGSVLGGQRGAGNGALTIANSTIVLEGTATLFDPGFDMQYAPTFHNVTLITADGTVSSLPAPAPTPA